MSYKSMSINELRAECKRRDIYVPPRSKKVDMVALLEEDDHMADADAVEAKVIEEDANGLSASVLPGTLRANFDALEARVDSILAQYDGWEPSADSAEDVEQCVRERKYLNGLAKQIDERRKGVKNEYLRPLEEFEARANAIRDKIKTVAGKVQAVEKIADDRRKAAKEAELRAHYEEFAPLLADVVPYEKIADPRWLNKQPHVLKCMEQLDERVQKVADDWATLKGAGIDPAFYDPVEMRFFDTLDLGQAIAWSDKLVADKEKLDRLKEEQADMRAEPAPDPVQGPEPEPDGEPVRGWYPGGSARQEVGEHAGPGPVRVDQIIAPKPGEPRTPWVVLISEATRSDMEGLAKLLKMTEVSGRIMAGTLEHVYRKIYGGR